jgi:hypothetical protein
VWANSFYAQYTGAGPTGAQLSAVATSISSNWLTDISPLQVGAITMTSVVCTDLASVNGASGENLTTRTGTRAGGELANSVAYLTTYAIARRYKGGHPRSYWLIGTATDQATGDSWLGGALTAFNTGITNFLAFFYGGGAAGFTFSNQCNVSWLGKYRPNIAGSGWPQPLVDPYGAGNWTGHSRFASQRRRIGRK